MDAKQARIQELLYELKVTDVMRAGAITTRPDQTMTEFRRIMRKHRISGTPVVENDLVVGMITIADLIEFLAAGEADCQIRFKMTPNPECLCSDQFMVHAIRQFDASGYGRYPVVDRQSRKLVGILTKGIIIEGMLSKMAHALKEEEIRQYRASHIFEDINAEYKELYLTYEVVGKDFDRAGQASTSMKRNLKRLGIQPDIIHRLAIASYEAEMNTVLYSDGGVMEFRIAPEEISLRIRDHGPGIEDIEKAMQPGWSAAADWVRELGFGAGMGIPNIKKCADKMDLQSIPGVGTTLNIRIFTGNSDQTKSVQERNTQDSRAK
ncbi:MAG: CBS domain-containing protein [Candidatus Eisenbacteria sp.]|nr:CBS domain-containing protein [Candidatus Eisenbacteria bacterium]